MRIVGFNLRKIEAERKKDDPGKLEIKTNLDIRNIEKEKIDLAGELLKFTFIYSIHYEPGFGELVFQGTALVLPPKPEDLKRILKDWKKKKLAPDVKLPVFNFIMSRCNLKALQLEEDFSLPPHIPLPQLTNQQGTPSTNYAG
jgi:hypothetical protein